MTQAAIQASKRALRREYLDRERAGHRAPLGDAVRACEARLLGLRALATCRTAALYAAHGHEVPVDGVAAALRERGLVVVLPRLAGAVLELHRVSDPAELVRGAFGLLEPPPGAPAVLPHEVDLFVIPGVAFDRAGNRLGRGGGHYDRLLAGARADARRVGVCYAERLLPALPVDDWDIPMCTVVTERELIEVERAR